jgi:hypothetical protein
LRRTHEKVVGIGVGSTNLEELHQVVELAVDITTDGDGAFLAGNQLKYLAHWRIVNIPLAARSTPPVELLVPKLKVSV